MIVAPADVRRNELSAPPPDYRRRLWTVLLIAVAYRLIFTPLFPLGPDECFYWDWSRHLDWGYVEHPPMIAFAIAAARGLLGGVPWAPRILANLLALASGLLLFAAGRRLFDERVGFWAATLHAVCPMFSMACGVMLLPEALLTFWVTLALYLAALLVSTERLTLFYALGLTAGAALLAKYPGVLIPAALTLFLVLSPKYRPWLRRREFFAFLLIAAVMFSPVIIWNVRHAEMGLSFIRQRTQPEGGGASLSRVWQSLLGQAGYHSPLLFVLLLGGIIVAGWRGWWGRDKRYWLLFCFSGPVVALFLVVSGFRHTLPHWPAAGYLAAYIAAPAWLTRTPRARTARRGRLLVAAAVVGALECAVMPVLLVYPLTTVAYGWLQPRLDLPKEVIEPMAEAYGWQGPVRDRILELRRRIQSKTGQTPVVLTHFHMLAALLAHSLRDDCPVVSVHAEARQYDIWCNDRDLAGKPVIYVSSENSSSFRGTPEAFYDFDACAAEPPLKILARGVHINTVHFWVCTGYRGPSAPQAAPPSSPPRAMP